METAPEINQETFEQLIDVAKRLNYGVSIKLNNGEERFCLPEEIARLTRDSIEILLDTEEKAGEPILFSDIKDVSAVSLRDEKKYIN